MAAGQTNLVYFLGVPAIEDEEADCEGSGGNVERTCMVVRSMMVVVVAMQIWPDWS
jgi:predicted enzyme related to lactoylglutathione lyase